MTALVLLPKALEELFEAGDFYEKDNPEAAEAFSAEIDRVFSLITENPSIGTPTKRGARRFTIQRFPYSIVYQVYGGRVFVVAIAHHRRRPWYWLKRLK